MQIDENARQVTIAGSHDVIVAGGGPAGVAVAIAAAQAGATVLLIEAAGALGGVWTSGLLTYVLDAGNKTGGVMAGLLERLRQAEGQSVSTDQAHDLPWVTGSWYFDPETMRAVLESWCSELGITVLYHSRVVWAPRVACAQRRTRRPSRLGSARLCRCDREWRSRRPGGLRLRHG